MQKYWYHLDLNMGIAFWSRYWRPQRTQIVTDWYALGFESVKYILSWNNVELKLRQLEFFILSISTEKLAEWPPSSMVKIAEEAERSFI